MANGIASLRHRAFAVKLALRKVAGFYSDMKRARLTERAPDVEDYAALPKLRAALEQFREAHERLETALLDEMVRLSIEAERTVNAYARTHYGFGPATTFRWVIRTRALRCVCAFTKCFSKAIPRATSGSMAASCRPTAPPAAVGIST